MDDAGQMSIAEKLEKQAALAREARLGPGSDTLAEAASKQDAPDNVLRHILPGQHLARIRIDLLSPAPEGQARQIFDEKRLRTLAESLKRSGVREPIIVTPHGAEPGRFQIVAGERRWRAAQIAGLTELPCLVDPHLVERRDKLLTQAEENLHRENLNPIEEATILAQIIEARAVSLRDAGRLLGKTYSQAKRLHQLHEAAAPIKQAVLHRLIDARTAIELTRLHNRLARQLPAAREDEVLGKLQEIIDRVIRERWSIRTLERYAPGEPAPTAPAPFPAIAPTANGDQPPSSVVSAVPSGPTATASALAYLRRGDRLVIEVGRIDRKEITPEERESLINILEDLLTRVRRA